MMAVSITYGWQICRTFKSDSRECPSRTGVGFADNTDRTCDWTSENVAVADAMDSAVIPDHLYHMSKRGYDKVEWAVTLSDSQ